MKKILFAVCLVLAGCAGSPQQQAIQQPDSPEKADALYRAKVHTELAASYFSRGQHAVALTELNEALLAYSSYSPAYNMLGLVYMDLKEDQKAEQNFEQALRVNPADSEVHNNYGWYLCNRGRAAESIAHFMAALKNPLYTTPDKAFLNAGICSRKAGNDEGAEKYLLEALNIQPLQRQALHEIADLYFAKGRWADARLYLGRLLLAGPGTAESLWLAVRLDRKLGDRDAEASHSVQLRKQFPDAPQTKAMMSGRYE